ncbi:MAG: signal peptide peptidase SppA [Desulfobacterales bacterium]|jgi:protease IV
MRTVLKSIGRILNTFWKGVTVLRRVFLNLLFIALVVLVIVILLSGIQDRFPSGAALVLAPAGKIVEQSTETLLVDRFYGTTTGAETVLRDLIDGIDTARNDPKIKILVLDLEKLEGAGISQLQEIGEALKRFKANGKTIFAFGDSFDQRQYYLAAHADQLYLHPMGQVWLGGLGIYRHYFKNALDKLHVDFHVFRVGTYKSALEPFMRNDMSTDDRKSNQAWLNTLWEAYTTDVAALRRLPAERIDDYINNLDGNLAEEGGDAARLALTSGLVDNLKTRDEIRDELIHLVGEDENGESYNKIDFDTYISSMLPKVRRPRTESSRVGLIVAEGIIMNGKQPAGRIGAESTAELIRQAREDEKIKAVVLRIDSGGGSAVASEIIRRELELTRGAGKPVVVSMSSIAASGAYWISVAADEIWALPTTITGSIGIFAALPTFDKTLKAIGINTDGVGTTRLSGAFDLSRPLNPLLADALQLQIERGYRRFIEQVSQGRNMTPEAVEKVAQGRVWAAQTAKGLGLIDKFGGLTPAVESAAKLAKLEKYDLVVVKQPLTARERLFKSLSRLIGILVSGAKSLRAEKVLHSFGSALNDPEIEAVLQIGDPGRSYALCLECMALSD